MKNNKIDLIYKKDFTEEEIRNIVKGLNSKSIPLYMEVKDELNHLVGFNKVITREEKNIRISCLKRRIYLLNAIASISNYFRVNMIIDSLEDELEKYENSKTYAMAMDGKEDYENCVLDMQVDIANLSRIKSYRIDKNEI